MIPLYVHMCSCEHGFMWICVHVAIKGQPQASILRAITLIIVFVCLLALFRAVSHTSGAHQVDDSGKLQGFICLHLPMLGLQIKSIFVSPGFCRSDSGTHVSLESISATKLFFIGHFIVHWNNTPMNNSLN